MICLLFEPDKSAEAKLTAVLANSCKQIKKVHSLTAILKAIDYAVFDLAVLNIDPLDPDKLQDVLHALRHANGEGYIVTLTAEQDQDKLEICARYHSLMVEYSESGLHDLRVLVRYIGNYHRMLTHHQAKTPPVEYIGISPVIKEIMWQIDLISNSDVHILITGETGSGKTELARYIHQKSRRRAAPFMHINCAAMPEYLIESELFGYKRGAFTGADKSTPGKFQAAQKGTICLDEIGEIPMHLQAKLLKVLDEKQYYPVGSTIPEQVKARIIAATNKDIVAAVKGKKFREDLYYRLNPFEINIPSLQKRPEDIPVLFDTFVENYCTQNKIRKPEIDPNVYEVLKTFSWPGNVRQVKSVVEWTMISKPEQISVNNLPPKLFDSAPTRLIQAADQELSLQDVKRRYARYVYENNEHNKLKTARILNIDAKTLRRLLN